MESHAQEGGEKVKEGEQKGRKEVSKKARIDVKGQPFITSTSYQYRELLADSKRNIYPTPFGFLIGGGGRITRFCNYISDRFDC